MNIAILAPSPVPFTLGGLEYLAQGIQRNINERTAHKAELFKLPVLENDFWTLMESYYKFFKLDVGHFDMCVSMKYPTWMARHDNHVLYMAHPLRGLYDTYHFTGQPMTPGPVSAKTQTLLASLDDMRTESDVEEVFMYCVHLRQLAKDCHEVARDFSFPGPVCRAVVRALDRWAFSKIRRFAAISRTVSAREAYFPEGASVKVLYPPSTLDGLRQGEDRGYFLSVSRLDNAKRVELFIRAMSYLESGELFIVGSGPEEGNLKAIAGESDRIKFLGRVPDRELVSLYSNCRAVVYAPYDEDYGLVTVEAFSSGKPVITCTDSGGVTELVMDGVTGMVALPSPDSISEKLRVALRDPRMMNELGQRGRCDVRNIKWENVVKWIIADSKSDPVVDHNKPRNSKIVVLSTFEIYPPVNGGQHRSFHLYSGLSALGDVTVISLGQQGHTKEKIIADGVKEIVIGRTDTHIKEESNIQEIVGQPVTDIVAANLMRYTPEFTQRLESELNDADIVVLSHPYLVDLLPANRNFTLLYDAHNVEVDLKRSILGEGKLAESLLEAVRSMEDEAIRSANKVFVCSSSDSSRLSKLYGATLDKFTVVPNGVEVKKTAFTDFALRRKSKEKYGVQGPIGLFLGSWHQPNIDAVKRIFSIAELLPNMHFFVAGSVSTAVLAQARPRNVGLIEQFDDDTKRVLLAISDVAVHPMDSGAGTNLKVFEYMASGLPIVSTKHGVRGLPTGIIQNMSLAESDEQFAKAIVCILDSKNELDSVIRNLRSYVETEFSWEGIIKRMVSSLINTNS